MNTDNNNLAGNFLINVPDIGEGIAEVEIVEWPINVGDSINEDDVICVVMTDKATVEIPSPIEGKITWLGTEAGQMLAVGAELVRLQVAGEGNTHSEVSTQIDQQTHQDGQGDIDIESSTQGINKVINEDKVIVEDANKGTPRPEGVKPIASPAVRRRARNLGIDLSLVQGTGPANRISQQDLDQYIADGSKPIQKQNTAIEQIKIIGLRRKISEIMQDTMQRIPHFTYVEEVDITELEFLRNQLNKDREDDQPKLTVLPFMIRALVKALKIYPEMSSRFDDQENIVHQYKAAHIGIATQTDHGLVVPVIKHAEALDLWQSAAKVKHLSTAARNGEATTDQLSGSTITITSLGPMGGIVTTPIINSPEVAIIGINKICKRPVWRDGSFVPREIMNLSSSFDHRIIDGYEATLFIQEIKRLLEAPATLFIER